MATPTPGYAALVFLTGTSTAFTNEACTLVSGKTYQINTSAKRILDPTVAVVVKDNGVDQTANVQTIDCLFGKVTFKSTYTVTGPVTIGSASYLPLLPFLLAQECKPSLSGTELSTPTLGGGSVETLIIGLLTGDITIKSLAMWNDDYDAGTGGVQSVINDFNNGTPKLIQLDPDGTNTNVLRAWVLWSKIDDDLSAKNLRAMSLSGKVAGQSPTAVVQAAMAMGAP